MFKDNFFEQGNLTPTYVIIDKFKKFDEISFTAGGNK